LRTVLRRIFGPKMEEDGSWRKLHDDEFHRLYFSLIIVRVIKFKEDEVSGTCGTHGCEERCLSVLSGMSEVKRPLGRPGRRWEDNIKMDLTEIGIDGANWILLAQDRVRWRAFVSTVMNLRVP
jgi:hypothetical protein